MPEAKFYAFRAQLPLCFLLAKSFEENIIEITVNALGNRELDCAHSRLLYCEVQLSKTYATKY